MRKRSVPLWLLVLLLLTGCAAGCAADGNAANSLLQGAAPGAPASGEATLEAAKTESQARALTEEEILAAYDRAVAAYEWFDVQTLPASEESEVIDGMIYSRVDYPGLETLEDLKTYLRGLFSEEIVGQLLPDGAARPVYLNVNGVLYGRAVSRSRDPYKGDSRAEVEQIGEEAYFVNVAVELLDKDQHTVTGLEMYAFPYEQANGRWVFTDFCLVD